VQATLTSLTAAGLVTRSPSDVGRSSLEVTETGRVRLDQLEAVHLRLLAEMPAGVAEPLLTFARRAQADFGEGAGSR